MSGPSVSEVSLGPMFANVVRAYTRFVESSRLVSPEFFQTALQFERSKHAVEKRRAESDRPEISPGTRR